jgi:Thermostable hemolysin
MFKTCLLGVSDRRRADVEEFIRRTYRQQFGANVSSFPQTLLGLFDPAGAVQCAAGLRIPAEGFFSECYLDQPVEEALSTLAADGIVARDKIFEVTTLVSRQPRAIARFIMEIVQFGNEGDFNWCFFTLTRRLSRMVEFHGVKPTRLAMASKGRVPDPSQWGTYYAHAPAVFATRRSQLSSAILRYIEEKDHAAAL